MLHFLHRHILLPAFETGYKRRKMFRYWKELERTQWFSRKDLERIQLEALRRLLRHAFATCPYYRDTWLRQGLAPEKLRILADLQKWPIIDRETVAAHRFEMRSQARDMRLIAKRTGGSTGSPLHFDFDVPSLDRRFAIWHRGYSWAGAGPGTKQLYLWGIPLEKRAAWKQWKDTLYNWLYRRMILNSFELKEEGVADYLQRFNRYRPDVVVAYTNPLYVFARALEERRLKPYSPKTILVGAEKLHDFQRETIVRVFQAPVFETYGSREFTLIAAECDNHRGLHLTMENYFFEILDDDGLPTPDGEEGNIAITDFFNYGMPFIRYLNGDRAIAGWGTCSCGRGLPLLRGVVGRQLDVLRTPDNRMVPGEFFPHLLKEFPAVRRFQVIQDQPDRIELRAVLHGSWTDADRSYLDQQVRKVIGPAMGFDFVPVDDIALTPTGKFMVVVNRCNSPATAATPAAVYAEETWGPFPPT